MRVPAFAEPSRHPAGVGLRSGPAPVGAGCLLLLCVISFPSFAAPPDCLVMGTRRWCLSDDSRKAADTVVYETASNEPHPATVRGRAAVVVGPIVAPLPMGLFLPQYFGPRRSQIGEYEPKEGAGDEAASR